MAAISAFGVRQHSQIFSLFFRNRIQCIALYQLHNSQALLNLRRISCHGRNHSQASCEYSLTIFLCCQHHSEYSLLGSKFSTNLLFAASKCHVTMQQRGSSSVQNGRTGWDRCSGETSLAPCTRKKRLQRKITKHCHWIGVQENIGMFSKS